MHLRFRLVLGLAALCNGPPLVLADSAPALRSAASFAVLGQSVTNSGPTIVTGDLGATTLQGFPPGGILLGRRMSERAAFHDAIAAWNDLVRRTCDRQAETLGGTLAPGVTCFQASARLSGVLTLDGGNDADAFWIMRVPGALTLEEGAKVRMIGGGRFGNVYWQVGQSAMLGANATLLGTLLARGDVTLGHAATVSGRVLAQNAVSLETNVVTLCCAPVTLTPAVALGIVGHAYEYTIAPAGATFTIVSGTPPPGLTLSSAGVLSGTPIIAGSSAFTVMATDAQGCAGLRQYAATVRSGEAKIPTLSRWLLLVLSLLCAILGSSYVGKS